MASIRKRFNEGKALDAVIRRIEARDDCERANGYSPERKRHQVPIDYACSLAGRLYAFEHTGIEPFPDHIEGEEHSRRLFRPLEQHLAGLRPNEWVQLHVPVDATAGLRGNQIKPIQGALRRWIEATVSTLPIAPYGRYATPVRHVTPTGVPFAVSLHRIDAPPQLQGRFTVMYLPPDDLEAARLSRIHKACDDKFPKLQVWKSDHNARTVLVLEDADIQLTNHQRVYEALVLAEDGRSNRPDEIYVVSTVVDDPWWVTCLRREGKTYWDSSERHWEISPQTLFSITGRER